MPLDRIATFVAAATPPAGARPRAATAVLDTIGVALAGSSEPAARIVRETISAGANAAVGDAAAGISAMPCAIWGDSAGASVEKRSGSKRHVQCASAPDAAFANGTAAHALDFDDMCFISLAHPSAPLVPAIVAAAELAGASGRALLDAYIVGFEVQARLGRLMNPRHYRRGWHCTSTLGTISAAAGASRVLGLDVTTTAHALGIAASSASGLKENFGTMVKPLHAGQAARDGVMAALLAQRGLTASARAIDGPQGFLHALDSERADLASETGDLGTRWEILDTGITVKLYPSCAGTHPTLDAILDLRARHRFAANDVDSIDVEVDPIVPTILLYGRPSSALEAKFSLPFCVAAAIAFGRVGIDTFDEGVICDAQVASLMPRVTMRVDDAIGIGKPALTEARVHVRLTDGRSFTQDAHGARGYPDNPASAAELDEKFTACARRALPDAHVVRLLEMLRAAEGLEDVRGLFRISAP